MVSIGFVKNLSTYKICLPIVLNYRRYRFDREWFLSSAIFPLSSVESSFKLERPFSNSIYTIVIGQKESYYKFSEILLYP